MKTYLSSFGIILLLSLTSCENLNEPAGQQAEYSVVFCLEANSEIHKLYVYNNTPLDEMIDGANINNYFVNGARIGLSSNNVVFNNFVYHDELDSIYIYYNTDYYQTVYYKNNERLKIIPGMEYELNIKISDEEITGNTIVPGDFELNLPARDTMKSEELNGIEIEWTESTNASVYVYGHRSAQPAPEWTGRDYLYFPEEIPRGGDYTHERKVKFEFYGDPFLRSDSVLIYVSAFDKNIFNHMLKGVSGSGLTNAYGVFGSSVTKTAVIVIDKD